MRGRIRFYTKTALAAAILSLLAPFAIPIGPIPLSFASLAVAVLSALLGSLVGSLAVLLYLAIGAVGVPVFSGFTAGFGILFGPSVGFFVGYLALALIAGRVARLPSGVSLARILPYLCLGELALLSLGSLGYAVMLRIPLWQAALSAFVPFLIPAALKAACGAVLLARLKKSRFMRLL